MSNNIDVLLVGTGYMGKEYSKVLKSQGVSYCVVGRSEENCEKFEKETETKAIRGGIEEYLKIASVLPEYAIVAVSGINLATVTILLLNAGVKNILVEKPGATYLNEIKMVCDAAEKMKAKVYIGYNRRFYASTEKALEIIKMDKGVTSFHFEFTEWGHRIRTLNKPKEILDTWLYANSSHVCDLAFFLGGFPREMSCYSGGEVDWHESGSIYTGAGVSEKGALFSYCANWAAPGRWSVEVMTSQHRLYFKPLEKLSIQDLGSVKVDELEIDDRLDRLYKPGLYKEVECFLNQTNTDQKVTIQDQYEHFKLYQKIECGSFE